MAHFSHTLHVQKCHLYVSPSPHQFVMYDAETKPMSWTTRSALLRMSISILSSNFLLPLFRPLGPFSTAWRSPKGKTLQNLIDKGSEKSRFHLKVSISKVSWHLASFPGPFEGEGERAWYTLLARACSYYRSHMMSVWCHGVLCERVLMECSSKMLAHLSLL